MPGRRFDRRAAVALLFVQLFFGAFSVLGKVAMREVSPMVLASFRAVFGALFLSLAARLLAPDEPPMTPRDRWTLIVLSLLGVAANQTLFISGLSRTTATHATLLICTIPVFTLVVGSLSRIERPSRARLAGIPLALAGVLFLLDLRNVPTGGRTLGGDLMIAANSLSYAVYLVAAREILSRRSAIAVIAALFRWGAAPILLLALPGLLRFRPTALSGSAWLAIAGIVVFATVLAYSLNAWALARTDAATTAVFVYVQPLVALTLAWVVLGERPGPRTFIAAALIFAGVALTIRRAPLSSVLR